MNIKKVVFFNPAARGDVFIGRGFIKKVIEQILNPNNIEYSYVTCWDHYFTKDISKNHSRWNFLDGQDKQSRKIDPQSKWFIDENVLYFNTWYCADFQKHFQYYGCSLKTMHCIFSDFYKIFDLKISEDIMDYLPVIDYSFYNIKNINNHFKNKDKNRKNIFISTSYPRSDQAPTDSLVGLIEKISNNFKECDFYITDCVYKSENVIYTGDVIYENNHQVITHDDLFNRHPPSETPNNKSSINDNRNYNLIIDMIESSYFSNFCDIIVGKSTGTYTHSLCKENILNNKTKFMGICSIGLSSANLNEIMKEKFYSITKSVEYKENENLELLTNLIQM